MNRYYILDIDGTLLPTAMADNRCFWVAVSKVLGFDDKPRSLAGFQNVTDIGILSQWCRNRLGRDPSATEVEQVQIHFLDGLRHEYDERPETFRPRRGLRRWLARRQADPGIRLALATGGWARTARFKLAASGLSEFDLPLATCDDGIERTTIMRRALDRVSKNPGKTPPVESICYLGDGVWDLLSCSELGWQFIGIAEGDGASRLIRAGALQVSADFESLDD